MLILIATLFDEQADELKIKTFTKIYVAKDTFHTGHGVLNTFRR